jgi:hypothetical protein
MGEVVTGNRRKRNMTRKLYIYKSTKQRIDLKTDNWREAVRR